MKHPEYYLQVAVCDWLNFQHPSVQYMSDTVANLKLTKMQAKRNKAIQKDKFKTPDVIIFEPRGKYHGLFVELKVKSPFKKNGELLKSDHLEGQQKTINDLNERGYYATFATGFDETVGIINNYMNMEKNFIELDNWISVKHDLPESGDRVLVYNGTNIYIGQFLNGKFVYHFDNPIKKWQPLPDKPK